MEYLLESRVIPMIPASPKLYCRCDHCDDNSSNPRPNFKKLTNIYKEIEVIIFGNMMHHLQFSYWTWCNRTYTAHQFFNFLTHK